MIEIKPYCVRLVFPNMNGAACTSQELTEEQALMTEIQSPIQVFQKHRLPGSLQNLNQATWSYLSTPNLIGRSKNDFWLLSRYGR